MLAVYVLSDLVSSCLNFFINNFEQVYYEYFLSQKSFFAFFWHSVNMQHYSKSNCLVNTQKIYSGAAALRKFQSVRLQVIIAHLSNLSKATFGNFQCHSFETKLWKCYYAIMNNPNLSFFTKLTRRWCNVASTLTRRSVFDVLVLTLY